MALCNPSFAKGFAGKHTYDHNPLILSMPTSPHTQHASTVDVVQECIHLLSHKLIFVNPINLSFVMSRRLVCKSAWVLSQLPACNGAALSFTTKNQISALAHVYTIHSDWIFSHSLGFRIPVQPFVQNRLVPANSRATGLDEHIIRLVHQVAVPSRIHQVQIHLRGTGHAAI